MAQHVRASLILLGLFYQPPCYKQAKVFPRVDGEDESSMDGEKKRDKGEREDERRE
jgi:hypothetical protein